MEDKHNLLRNIAHNWLSIIRESEDYIDEFNIVDFLMKDERATGRREVLEEVDKNWTFFEDDLPYFEKGDVFIKKDKWKEIKDLTSDPQTPQLKKSLKDLVVVNAEESSSEGCGIIWKVIICGKRGFICDECKQKQEKKE